MKTRQFAALGLLLLGVACASDPSGEGARPTSASASGPGGSAGDGGRGSGGHAGGGGAHEVSCDADAVDGIEVTRGDPLGFPPYAVDGCSLLYVHRDRSLRLRHLATGTEETLAKAMEAPCRPTASGDTFAWEASVDGRTVVRIRSGDVTRTVEGSFDHAGEPRATADAVVFTAWLGPNGDDDTDVLLFHVGSGKTELVGGGPGQQRFSDVSADHVAYSDFSEDPDGCYDGDEEDLADIVVVSRATMTRWVRERPGKQAFPMLGAAGRLAYLDWNAVHPEPKFEAYQIFVASLEAAPSADELVADVRSDLVGIRPTAAGALLDWVNEGEEDESPALFRRPADLSTKPKRVDSIFGGVLAGPSATLTMTVVGTDVDGFTSTLRGIAR